jgi:hypothetical protein
MEEFYTLFTLTKLIFSLSILLGAKETHQMALLRHFGMQECQKFEKW